MKSAVTSAINVQGVSLVLATHNPGKMKEFRALLAGAPVQGWSAGELGLRAPEETGTTYRENAEIKARAVLAQCLDLPLELRRKLATPAPAEQSPQTEPILWVLADDSGLDLAGLDGFPGPYAARLAQEAGGYGQAVERVWSALEKKNPAWAHRQKMEASMTCVLCLLGGLLSDEAAGANRFPAFVPEWFPEVRPGRALFFEGRVKGWLARASSAGRPIDATTKPDRETGEPPPNEKPGQTPQGETFGEGFGYDPFFSPDAQPETNFAQMSLATKGLHSHRGHAVRALLAQWKGRHT